MRPPPPCEGSGHIGSQHQERAVAEDTIAPVEDHLMAVDADEPGYASEEDVFGHGGGLDNHEPTRDREGQAEPATTPGVGNTDARTNRRRKAVDIGTRDFTAEAIQRLGSSLTRRDTDAAGRMQQLRRRVAEKAAADRTELHFDTDAKPSGDARAQGNAVDQGHPRPQQRWQPRAAGRETEALATTSRTCGRGPH